MNKDYYFFFTCQCLLVLISGLIGLVGIGLTSRLPGEVTMLFTIVFSLCIVTALFFLLWVRHEKKREHENTLIDSIGETE